MKVVLYAVVYASILFGRTMLCPSVMFFVSCVSNHTTHTIWVPAVGAVLFVAKHWCSLLNISPPQLDNEVELSSCGYNKPLEVHQTLSPLQYWVIPIHKAIY